MKDYSKEPTSLQEIVKVFTDPLNKRIQKLELDKKTLKEQLILSGVVVSETECRLFDLYALDPKEYHKYTTPIYTKLDGMYGYISVSGYKVFFFCSDVLSGSVSCDDVSEKFRIEYVTKNGN